MHFAIEGVRHIYPCYVGDLEGIDVLVELIWLKVVDAVLKFG